MKDVTVRVSGGLGDIIYYKDKPHTLEKLSFVRDECHNAQLIVYATMTPCNAIGLHAIVDDMENEIYPDRVIGNCHFCQCQVHENENFGLGTIYHDTPLCIHCYDEHVEWLEDIDDLDD